jgi:TPR repeat protein
MRVLLAMLVVVASQVATATAEPAACGARCADAAKFLGGKRWNYRKAANLYKQACKKDESGPPEACRRLALLGLETRGITFDKPTVLRMLKKTCDRGDVTSCAWVVIYEGGRVPELAKLAMVEAPCASGDRAACEPLLAAISAHVEARNACKPEWWALADRTCSAGFPEGCITYRHLLFKAEDTCTAPAHARDTSAVTQILEKQCAGGFPDACTEISTSNLDWEARCKAGEQFACDAR